jgi:hypothetical protein
MGEGASFSLRAILVLVGCVAIAFAFSMFLEIRGGDEDGSIIQPSTYSHAAIGHAGLYEMLRRLDFPVARSRLDAASGLGQGGVMVLAEPEADTSSVNEIAFKAAPTLLLILPKRTGARAPDRSDWIGYAELLDLRAVRLALGLLVRDGDVVRGDPPKSWSTNSLGVSPQLGPSVQFVHSAKLKPIISAGKDILLGEMRDGNRRIVVLADPDPIENHMIAEGGNAAFAVALFGRLRSGDGRIIFDETIHGLRGAGVSPFALLFRFPFIVATGEVLIALALLLLATMSRFGAAEKTDPPIGFGKSRLIANSAALLDHAGYHPSVMRRYLQVELRAIGRSLHAPAGLDDAALAAWIDRVAAARGAPHKATEILRRGAESGGGKAQESQRLFALAREIHQLDRVTSNGPAAR